MIGYCHSLERDFLGVFEKTIGSPNEAEPLDREQAVLAGHILGQFESMVLPFLSEKNIGGVCLEAEENMMSIIGKLSTRM